MKKKTYKQTQKRNGMGFWFLVILLHRKAIHSEHNIKGSCPKVLESNYTGRYRSGGYIWKKRMAMGKLPIITAFCWKAGPNSCQILETKTCIENLKVYWQKEPGDRVQVDCSNWEIRGDLGKKRTEEGPQRVTVYKLCTYHCWHPTMCVCKHPRKG